MFKTSLLFGSVRLDIFLKRVLELGERSCGPVKGRDIKLMDGLGSGGGKRAKETAVESSLKGKNRHLGRTRARVDHGRGDFLLRKGSVVATLLGTLVHKSSLVGSLVGTRAREIGPDLVKTRRSTSQQTLGKDVSVVRRREVTQSRSVDNGIDVLVRLGSLDQSGVIVTKRDRGNLGVDIEESVSVNVNNVITIGLVVVGNIVSSTGVKNLGKLFNCLLVFGAGELSLNNGDSRLVGVVCLGQRGEAAGGADRSGDASSESSGPSQAQHGYVEFKKETKET